MVREKQTILGISSKGQHFCILMKVCCLHIDGYQLKIACFLGGVSIFVSMETIRISNQLCFVYIMEVTHLVRVKGRGVEGGSWREDRGGRIVVGGSWREDRGGRIVKGGA